MSCASGCCIIDAQGPVYLCPVEHHYYMQRCLELAALGLGNVAPNPMVGCVIAHQGRIIGEGCHRVLGGPHAEVEAVRSVADRGLLRESVMYVSLEPCAHHGRTPPCADLIIECGVPEVHVATIDPFALVAGKGIARLREAGVKVHVGLLEHEARTLNRRFFTFHSGQRPYLILKWAETADGFVDRVRVPSHDVPERISGDAAQVLTHAWRAQEAAIMVGTGTALMDDPSLTVRAVNGRNPLRIILDRRLRLPATAKVFSDDADTLVLNEVEDRTSGRTRWVRMESMDDIHALMQVLWKSGVQSVLVEGGPELHRRLFHADLWDEVRRYVSPKVLGSGVAAATVPQRPGSMERVGADVLYHYSNRSVA